MAPEKQLELLKNLEKRVAALEKGEVYDPETENETEEETESDEKPVAKSKKKK